MSFSGKSRSDSDRLAWPILLLLLTVLVPSAGVVWMMREAVRNERLATSQRLREAYEAQLQAASQTVQQRWADQLDELARQVDHQEPALSFARIVAEPDVDSVLICDAEGRIVYPDQPSPNKPITLDLGPEWTDAEQLEFSLNQVAEAAEAYEHIAGESADPIHQARARQAQARCLIKLGDREAAVEVLQALRRQQPGLHDEQGRSFAAAAELRLLEIVEPESNLWHEVDTHLAKRLGDYRQGRLPSAQRRFLMTALQHLDRESFQWPTKAAEILAAEVVATHGTDFAPPGLHGLTLPGVWSQTSPDGRVVELLRTATIRDRLLQLTEALPLSSGVAFTVTPPQEPSQNLMELSLGEPLGGWRLGLAAAGGDPFEAISQHRRAVHAWIALLVVGATCALAWLLAGSLRRRLRLAKLKNDLVATVSHELKTPLASIRLLVDTLLEEDSRVTSPGLQVNVREYLELIAQENARLTRLIDNFLTFSRLERGKHRFTFEAVEVREIVRRAAQVFREHHVDADQYLQVEEGPKTWIPGDTDALVTAVVNLLENAWKYSDEQKQITLVADVEGDQATLAVRDNGIGLSTRAAKRVFDRFYQVDQRVARSHGGCGLGLSIVRAIVQAHGGEARVQSQPGKGSTFTLCLPIDHPENAGRLPRPAQGDMR